MAAFTPAGSGGLTPSVTVIGPINPDISNIPMPLASTEYSFSLPVGTKKFLIKLRNKHSFQFSYSVGASGTNFIGVPWCCFYAEEGLSLSLVTHIYFQSSQAGEIAEILVWT